VLRALRRFAREEAFFDLFEANAANLVIAAKTLLLAVENPAELAAYGARLTEVEHAADEVTHRMMAALQRAVLTPFDREETANLAQALDDVVDHLEMALMRMILFRLAEPSRLAQDLARIVLHQAEAIARAFPLLRARGDHDEIRYCLVEIHRLENEGDRLLDRALGSLYDEVPDLAALTERLKWREVYDLLETATNRAEDVANLLESLALQRS
jgi:predicted phosphate transport protein (TIGR00153 family)